MEAREKGDLRRARDLVLADTLFWLEHYFHGTVDDDGPFESDMVILPGIDLLRSDVRVFFVPIPEGKRADMPVACVAINHVFFAKGRGQCNDNEDKRTYRLAMEREYAIMRHLKPRLLRWRERKFKQKIGFGGDSNSGHQGERCFVVLRYYDRANFYVYDYGTGKFRPCDFRTVASEDWLERPYAILN